MGLGRPRRCRPMGLPLSGRPVLPVPRWTASSARPAACCRRWLCGPPSLPDRAARFGQRRLHRAIGWPDWRVAGLRPTDGGPELAEKRPVRAPPPGRNPDRLPCGRSRRGSRRASRALRRRPTIPANRRGCLPCGASARRCVAVRAGFSGTPCRCAASGRRLPPDRWRVRATALHARTTTDRSVRH